MMQDVSISFAPNQTLPPGYSVEWWPTTEHYHWVYEPDRVNGEPETYSVIFGCRFAARRSAWRHYRKHKETD